MQVKIYAPNESILHHAFPFISEQPVRFKVLISLLETLELPITSSGIATQKMVEKAHKPSYVSLIKDISETSRWLAPIKNVLSTHVQSYTRVSSGTYHAALAAAGAVCQAVNDTMQGEVIRSFCVVRPPGHHAGPERGEGFCIFNNVAIGALHALSYGAERVAIIDIDRHHGNGTEAIVAYYPKQLLLISSYQEGCKYAKATPSLNNVLRGPIAQHSNYSEVEHFYTGKALTALHKFQPDLIIVSAGFDMHVDDPLTNLKLETEDYGALTALLVEVANKFCKGRLISVLEGGYELKALKLCVGEHLKALSR